MSGSTEVTLSCICGRSYSHYCFDPAWAQTAGQPTVTDAETQIAAVRDLIRHARLISPSERAVIYVADLERALGIDAPVPHKLGGNE